MSTFTPYEYSVDTVGTPRQAVELLNTKSRDGWQLVGEVQFISTAVYSPHSGYRADSYYTFTMRRFSKQDAPIR